MINVQFHCQYLPVGPKIQAFLKIGNNLTFANDNLVLSILLPALGKYHEKQDFVVKSHHPDSCVILSLNLTINLASR